MEDSIIKNTHRSKTMTRDSNLDNKYVYICNIYNKKKHIEQLKCIRIQMKYLEGTQLVFANLSNNFCAN